MPFSKLPSLRNITCCATFVDINEAAAKETAEIILGEGGDAGHGRADVADAVDVAHVVSSCLDRFGRIDALHKQRRHR